MRDDMVHSMDEQAEQGLLRFQRKIDHSLGYFPDHSPLTPRIFQVKVEIDHQIAALGMGDNVSESYKLPEQRNLEGSIQSRPCDPKILVCVCRPIYVIPPHPTDGSDGSCKLLSPARVLFEPKKSVQF